MDIQSVNALAKIEIPWVTGPASEIIEWIQVRVALTNDVDLVGYVAYRIGNNDFVTLQNSTCYDTLPTQLEVYSIPPIDSILVTELYDFDTVVSPFSPLPPAVMGSFSLHVGTSGGTSGEVTGATIDLVPNNIELCIDTEQVDDNLCTDTTSPIPFFNPIDGESYVPIFTDGTIRTIQIKIPESGMLSIDTNGDQQIDRQVSLERYVSITHLNPETLNLTNLAAGAQIGEMCNGTAQQVETDCDLRPDAPNHVAVELRVREVDSENTIELYIYLTRNLAIDEDQAADIVEREILGLLAHPLCLFDQWMPNVNEIARATPSLGTCSGAN